MKLEKLFHESEIPVGFYFIKTIEEVFEGTAKEDNENHKELKEKWSPKCRKKSIGTDLYFARPYYKSISRLVKL